MFEKRHRFGFARGYGYEVSDKRKDYESDQEFQERNNLVFVAKPGFNYDHPRKPGEGDDWED